VIETEHAFEELLIDASEMAREQIVRQRVVGRVPQRLAIPLETAKRDRLACTLLDDGAQAHLRVPVTEIERRLHLNAEQQIGNGTPNRALAGLVRPDN
jgi:hypothetical protein